MLLKRPSTILNPAKETFANPQTIYVNFKETRRLGNVRSHIKMRPRLSTLLT